MSTENQKHELIARLEAVRPWLTEWVEVQQGTGLILFFWLFASAFLGSIVLLCLGVLYWSFWIFMLGVLTARLFVFLVQIGTSFFERVDPSHG